jgi:hypothetical protein
MNNKSIPRNETQATIKVQYSVGGEGTINFIGVINVRNEIKRGRIYDSIFFI